MKTIFTLLAALLSLAAFAAETVSNPIVITKAKKAHRTKKYTTKKHKITPKRANKRSAAKSKAKASAAPAAPAVEVPPPAPEADASH